MRPSSFWRLGSRSHRALLVGRILAVALLLPLAAPAQGVNAFEGIEARTLPNGLTVWVRPFAGEASVEVTLIVSGGSSLDPAGKEELAHFVEHLVFGDRPGVSEQALNREIESLGGKITANTSADRTMFRVTLPAASAEAGIAWMARLVTPRPVSEALLDQQRSPILLELGASRRSPSEWVRALYVDPPFLRRASAWKRELGLETLADRDYYPFRSLQRITPTDVQDFTARYYVPANMTLVVTGGMPPAGVWEAVTTHFGGLSGPPAAALPRGSLQGSQRDVTVWTPQREARYMRIVRGAGLTARDRVLVLFLREFLDKRLNDRLRFGAEKLVYHPSVSLAMQADAAIMTIYAASDGARIDAVQIIIDEEVARLRAGHEPDSAFVADRDAIAQRFRASAGSAHAVNDAATQLFFATGTDRAMPDMVALYEQVTPSMLATLLRERLPTAGDNLRLFRPLPFSPVVLVLLAIALAASVIALMQRRLLRPVDMRGVRYVARVRTDLVVLLVWLLIVGGIGAVVARLLAAGARPFLEGVVFPLPGALLQWAVYAIGFAGALAVLIALAARVPRKILVFEDHARMKYLSYRSVILPPNEIAECRRASFGDVWLGRRLWRCLPLTLGMGTPGLYLRRRSGGAWYFRVRATDELESALATLRGKGATAEPAAPR